MIIMLEHKTFNLLTYNPVDGFVCWFKSESKKHNNLFVINKVNIKI